MSFSVIDFFKFASKMPRIVQILVSTFKIFREGRGGGGRGREAGVIPPDPPRNVLLFSLAIPGSDKGIILLCFPSLNEGWRAAKPGSGHVVHPMIRS